MLKNLVKFSNHLSNHWMNISSIKRIVYQPKIFDHYSYRFISFNTEYLISRQIPLLPTHHCKYQTWSKVSDSNKQQLFTSWCQWSNAFLKLSLFTEGAGEKLSQFIMLLKSICNKKLLLWIKMYFLNIAERLKQ